MISTPQTYREKLHLWCVIRHLPNLQRLTVARFRRKNEATEHLQALQRLRLDANHVVIFDANVTETKE